MLPHYREALRQPGLVEDAYSLALEWARAWKVPTEPLERWHAGDTSASVDAVPERGTTIGRGGPEPVVKIRKSFVDDKPLIVSLQFQWPSPSLAP